LLVFDCARRNSRARERSTECRCRASDPGKPSPCPEEAVFDDVFNFAFGIEDLPVRFQAAKAPA
jgi:hypothetical protein